MDPSLIHWQKINKKSLEPPRVAWPTVLLFFTAVILFVCSISLTIHHQLPILIGIIANTISQFMLFTVLHDASHRAVSQNTLINESLGSIAAFIISPVGGVRLFRFVHMQHHRFTNEGRDKDPDEWCGKGRVWSLPLRWLTLDLHYVVWYFQRWNTRPTREKIEFLIIGLAAFILMFYLYQWGYGVWLVCLWLIPSRLTTAWLALAFDFLPHFPHDTTGEENELRATHVKPNLKWLMTPLFLCQNYHLIHHLYPRIPFYRYPWVWSQAHQQLIASGARVMSWSHQEIKPNNPL